MHRSGVLRSLPGIGFGLYYPAGPGGYFDYQRNGIYAAQLALWFRIGRRAFRDAHDFAPGQLSAPYHSKNILAYAFEAEGVRVKSEFVQVNEDAIAARIELNESAGRSQPVRLLALHAYVLGKSEWWGRDGLAGGFDSRAGVLWIRSFAAGTVFAIAGSESSAHHFFTNHDQDREQWFDSDTSSATATSYYPEPLFGALRYDIELSPKSASTLVIAMARGTNASSALERARTAVIPAPNVIARKRTEDDSFWSGAPKLTGDWPNEWMHGWVYDFETLRMVSRGPIGVYKHPWDAMQIQAPRNVLAETSIDSWALSYADPEVGKTMFAGQFLDALKPNIPCMREDGVMNMVAADGSECGTAISWCFPFFCGASIFDRTRDLEWLARVYPGLARLLRWTLANRRDSGGFLVGKCSWETGMDASRRFQIHQATGGELVEFIRLVELQAAAAHAGATLERFAKLVGDEPSVAEWQQIHRMYSAKTEKLWKDNWFHDFDTRKMQLVTWGERDPAQAAPAFCGIATAEQKRAMLPVLHEMYDRSLRPNQKSAGWDDPLAWSPFVLPYLESLWAADDRRLACEVVDTIAGRIYRSMDRRSLGTEKLGWPGVSCEIWGAQGAFGGEGYGWGAVMPAHIIRNVIGFRETEDAVRVWICPNFPIALARGGKQYAVAGLNYGSDRANVHFRFADEQQVQVAILWSGARRVGSVQSSQGRAVQASFSGAECQFEAKNHERYLLELSG